MARANIWVGWKPAPQPWENGSIELERFELLQGSAKPFALLECRDLHGCSTCLGWGEVRGAKCGACNGSGVGAIKEGSHLFCDACGCSGLDGDPRLQIRPGELPRREPRQKAPPKPKPTLKAVWPDDPPKTKRGRPKGSKNKPKVSLA
jgi:hypothetical protein